MIPKIEELSEAFKNRDLNTVEVSKLTDLSETTIRSVRKGHKVNSETAMKISFALRVSASDVFAAD